MESILFLAAPITACFLLSGILGYFGNHILSRGVIFVDIAVAQVAALGTMIGILLGANEGSLFSSLFSLGFTLIIVSAFAISKFKHKEFSQEVIIGIIYCMALAGAMVMVDMVSGGSNFIQKTITGAVLWVTWKDILVIFLIFLIVFLFHLVFLKRFIKISQGNRDSFHPSELRLLELVFYISFGIVVVQSVKIGGIFMVFMYLIGPAAMTLFITENWKNRFILSWIFGFGGSIIGLVISFIYNFPNGPAIVCTLGLMLIIIPLFSNNKKQSSLVSHKMD
ncbi:metal ABC transporter permease [candidate division KSB1 bacterium]|nr:metal ABC transporter permease [candidate division KSB1 bacterium]